MINRAGTKHDAAVLSSEHFLEGMHIHKHSPAVVFVQSKMYIRSRSLLSRSLLRSVPNSSTYSRTFMIELAECCNFLIS